MVKVQCFEACELNLTVGTRLCQERNRESGTVRPKPRPGGVHIDQSGAYIHIRVCAKVTAS